MEPDCQPAVNSSTSSSFNNIINNTSNKILRNSEIEGVSYAPTFDRLFIYGKDRLNSRNMEQVLCWCQEKVVGILFRPHCNLTVINLQDHFQHSANFGSFHYTTSILDCKTCWCKLKEVLHAAEYKKELEEKEKEIDQLKEKLKEAEEKAAASATVAPVPAPRKLFHSSSVDPPTPPPPVSHSAPNLPPPPPPPPPPAIKIPQKIILQIKKKTNTEKIKDQSSSSPFVTPEAIRSVRLKKTEEKKPTVKYLNVSGLVTLDALKSISLRRTQSTKTLKEVGKENLHQMLAHEVLNRRALKKTTLKRSPGGTPLDDKRKKRRESRRESGQGLTPIMTKALKRKFRLVESESLSSDEGAPSANSSPDLSFYNQTINTSAGDLSWSTSPTDPQSDCSSGIKDRMTPLSERSLNTLDTSNNLSASSPNLVF